MSKENRGAKLAKKIREDYPIRDGSVIIIELDSGERVELPGRYKAHFEYGHNPNGDYQNCKIKLCPVYPVHDTMDQQAERFVGHLRNQLNRIVRNLKKSREERNLRKHMEDRRL